MPILKPSGLFSVMFNTFLILFSAEVKKEVDYIQTEWAYLPKRGSPSISKQCLKNLLP